MEVGGSIPSVFTFVPSSDDGKVSNDHFLGGFDSHTELVSFEKP